MTPRQRTVLMTLASVVAVLALVVAGLALAHHTGASSRLVAGTATPSSTAVPPSTVTTVDLVPVSPGTVLATTLPVTAPTTAPPPPSSTTTMAPLALDGSGAVLMAPTVPDQRPTPAGSSCQVLADLGWSDVVCGQAHAQGATLTWLTESRPGGGSISARRAYVFRPVSPVMSAVVLQTADDQGIRFAGIKVRVDMVAGDGNEDLVFGFRNLGSGSILSVDLVRGPGAVVVHSDLSHGAARAGPGQLDTWAAVFGPGDANCCPSSYQHDTIRLQAGAWRIAAQAGVGVTAIPPSQL